MGAQMFIFEQTKCTSDACSVCQPNDYDICVTCVDSSPTVNSNGLCQCPTGKFFDENYL